MRDPKRIDRILVLLEEYWKMNPDCRLGQILEAASWKGGHTDHDLFYCEDDLILSGLADCLAESF